MITRLTIVGIMVRDQDEALRFYTETLGFEKRTDQNFGPGWRWLTVAPKDQKEVEITSMKPDASMFGEERARILTDQIGKAPTWSYSTDDCRKTYEELLAKGVKFSSLPTEEFYGIEAVFEDLYGTPISMVELSSELRERMESR
jgi:catechol 2,3-dioxygenase-like lactoylglutathione lyase family enzyme